MVYQNSVLGIFNQSFIETQLRQQHHNNQVINSIDCANKLREFLESTDKIEPDYESFALQQCCVVIGNYMKMHGRL